MERLAIRLRLAFANSASNTIGGIYTPFFSAWLLWRGMHPAEIGALLAAGMLLRVIASPVSGIVADARNDRRTAMIALYLFMLFCAATLIFATSPFAIFALAVPMAVASGAVGPLLESVTLRMSERWKFSYGPVRA
ncbi:MAG TPA: MFS transporter, partial [Rhizomicrobium sp.]|nr:MFS transporter [Rhizomicrobium sp.]